jgi:hypothetical protein
LKINGADKVTVDEDVSEFTMNLFIDWLYTGKLNMDSMIKADIQEMLNAVVFGHDCMAPLFHAAVHNVTVDKLVYREMVCSASCVNLVFERLPEDNVLRELFVELECCYKDRWLNDSKLPVEFVQMVREKADRGEYGDDDVACNWHVHGSEEEKSECERAVGDFQDWYNTLD